MNKKIWIVSILFVASAILFFQFLPIHKKSEMESIYRSLKNCNVQEKGCKADIGNISFTILMDKDIFYLKKFNINVFSENKLKKNIKSMKVYFKMTNMNMGNNAFVLNKERDNWKATAVLPICVSGRADWISELEVVIEDKKYFLKFPIQVKK